MSTGVIPSPVYSVDAIEDKTQISSVEQVQQLLAFVHGNVLESAVLLSVLFGLRLSEALGLRWRDVDLTHRQITLHGQLPCDLPHDTKIVVHLEPLKNRDEGETRTFPITEEALPIFLRLRQEQTDQRRLCKLSGVEYQYVQFDG